MATAVATQTITINPKFANLLPPLLPEEDEKLEASILTDGVRERIILWNGAIVDGHNRYRIASKHGIPVETIEKDFEDEDAVVIWIIETQIGRRNLTDEQRSFKRGELYKLIAKKRGGSGANQHTAQKPQNEASATGAETEKQKPQNEVSVFDVETASTDVDVTVEQSTDKPAKKSGIVRSGNMLRTVRPLRTPKTKTFLTEYLQP